MDLVRGAVRVVLLLLLLLACARSSEHKVSVGELPADPLAAARELGNAAVKEKDAKKLAGKIAAFLARIEVPVVSLDGKGLLVKGHLDWPPRQVFLWEPVVGGVARATAKGDRRRFTVIAKTLFPDTSLSDLDEFDFGRTFLEAAKDIASKKGTSVDAMLVTAIATDLETRGNLELNPWLDPTASLLFGLWAALSSERAASPAVPAPSGVVPEMPGLPPGFPLPQPNQLGGEGPDSGCAFMAPAGKIAKAFSVGVKVGGWLGDNRLFGVLGKVTRVAQLPQMVAQAISGMGIAAFVDVTGDVKKPSVKYGDGPVTYTVRVESKSPFDKKQLDSFVNCLEALSPSSTLVLEPLRDLPPKGPMANIPVYWDGTAAYDPKHGKFEAKDDSAPKGFIPQLVKAGMQVAGGSMTGPDGTATAKFQVKPKSSGKSQGMTHVESFTISAIVFPFPLKPSLIYQGSNLISNRAVPLRLEIEVPLPKDWVLDLKENLFATGEGISGGWTINVEASVPFSLGPNLDFSSEGGGSWSFGFNGGMGGVVACKAPVQKYSFDLKVSGKVTNVDTMSTHFDLSDRSTQAVNGTLTCTGMGGLTVRAPLKGPTSGSITGNTPVQSFEMPLQDGATRSFPLAQGSA